jgi:chemotaxis protein histidine kinase CheA
VQLGKYLKVAFTNQWNLLALFGGLCFAVLSGRLDVVLPLILAAETAYLGLLGTHPKFQKYVDAQQHKAKQSQRTQSNQRALQHILQVLPREDRQRYDELRTRCLDLRQIAADLKQPGVPGLSNPLDSIQLAGLDRLLWVYLRLLFTRHSLARFLQQTQADRIRNDIERTENRLKSFRPDDNSPHAQKMRRTLDDNLKTSHDRLANYDKARSNFEFVELEIDRLENKIKSLAEVAINRQEPDFISSQVDQVANSMLDTEKAMNELDFATGLGPIEEEAPDLLQPRMRVVE